MPNQEDLEDLEKPVKNLQQHRAVLVDLDYLLQFFQYAHLPEHLQAVSKPFCDMANTIVETLPANPERSMALRKLLEAKDCAVRALLFKA